MALLEPGEAANAYKANILRYQAVRLPCATDSRTRETGFSDRRSFGGGDCPATRAGQMVNSRTRGSSR